jgi:hypothetical protein
MYLVYHTGALVLLTLQMIENETDGKVSRSMKLITLIHRKKQTFQIILIVRY